MSSLHQVERIFAAAIDLPREERNSHIKQACQDDADLLAQVQSLVAAHEAAASGFLDSPLEVTHEMTLEPGVTEGGAAKRASLQSISTPPVKLNLPKLMDYGVSMEKEGDIIHRYKLLQQIGEGGFGVVWMAEQTEPIVRKVALKVIKAGMDTKEVLVRFEAERQALAMMDHPHIAKVLDAGATESGRPFFVMELVKGVPITLYCDEAGMDTRARLGLFVDVCSAINHAHQKGIIHRDIKPSNIMITRHGDKPVVKVIDFGIAKATQGRLTDKTLFTRFEQFVGTPAYMSPEQAALSGLDIDTRSDVYALGVLLYELLAGKPPFDAKSLASGGYDEMRRIIREEEPPSPARRLSSMTANERTALAKSRSSTPEKIKVAVERDLDLIVMKAIEKDRSCRYESANGLARDVGRFLAHEPVRARPLSVGYRVQKYARRHRVMLRVVGTIIFALFGASVVSIEQAMIARRAQDRAEEARAEEMKMRQRAVAEAERANAAELKARAQRLIALREAYAADMMLCDKALAEGNLREARELLDRHRPTDGETDLRGWEWRWLWSACRSGALYELAEADSRALTAFWLHGGETVATYHDSGGVRLWTQGGHQMIELQEKTSLDEENKPLRWRLSSNTGFMAVSPDRRRLAAVGSPDMLRFQIRIWDAGSAKVLRTLQLGEERPAAVTFSPDGTRLAAYIHKRATVRMWNTETGVEQEVMRLPGWAPDDGFFPHGAICFDPAGQALAIGGRNQAGILDLASGHLQEFSGRDRTKAMVFSPDGRFLATGCGFLNPEIAIIDRAKLGRGEPAERFLSGHNGFIASLAFSPDGTTLASAGADQSIKLWDTESWEERDVLLGHTDEVWSVDFSKDGGKLLSSGKDKRILVWSPAAAAFRSEKRLEILGSTMPFSWSESPDGASLVAVEHGRVVLHGNAELTVPVELGGNNRRAFWLEPRRILIAGRNPAELKLWDLNGNTIERYPLGLDHGLVEAEHLPAAGMLVVSGRDAAVGAGFTMVRWDIAGRRVLSTYSPAHGNLRSGAQNSIWSVSQDGKRMAIHSETTVEVHDLEQGLHLATLAVTNRVGMQGMALSPDGRELVVAARDRPSIMVLDVDSGELKRELSGHNLVISRLQYSVDGTRLLSSTIGTEPIKLWDTRIWKPVCRLSGRSGTWLNAPSFSAATQQVYAMERSFGADSLFRREAMLLRWQAPSWEEIAATEKNGRWK